MESGPSISADSPPRSARPPPMPAPDDEGRRDTPPSSVGAREIMDVDLDLDHPDSWPFDPLALIASPTSFPFPFPFPSPPSPLWLFEDRAFDASALIADCQRLLAGNSEATNGNTNLGDNKTVEVQLLAEDDSSALYLMKERMAQALRYLKESTDQHVLVQVWAPVRNGNRYVLTTSEQPFVLDPQSTGLLQYRTVSLRYIFSVDGDGDLGLPGRVFRQKMPEWTPNVQYYSSKEYPRLCHALNYDVRGTLALPVFEPSAQFCVGVVELIMTSQKVNYAGEVDKVCKALEAVNLKSFEIMKNPSVQICNEGRQAALAEILQTIAMVCEKYKLPLAQTWVPCRHRTILADGGGSKKSCSSFDGSCMGQVCMSTTDVAFHVIDAHLWGFREACVEHHLQKGQGVAGMSFALRRPCFSKDITQFCKIEYPLVHYARMFKLRSCFAICLQSSYTGNDDYLLEFFLPLECKTFGEQQALLKSMISLMTKCFHSLRPSIDVEPQEGKAFDLDVFAIEYQELEPKFINIVSYEGRHSESSEIKSNEGLDDPVHEENKVPEISEEHLTVNANVGKNGNIVVDGSASCSSSLINKKNKPLEKRRGKAEKTISLEVLQQYFCGSLKDAAKSLGVCPTTMKRICRQHGISRWPSRKINKVNRSLSKLKQVIESVQGADSAFNLTTLTGSLPVGVGSTTWTANVDELKQSKITKSLHLSERCKETSMRGPSYTEYPSTGLRESVDSHSNIQLEPGKDIPSSKSRSSSGQGSTSTPASEGSCHGSPINDTHECNQIVSSNLEAGTKPSLDATKPCARVPNALVLCSTSDAILMEPQATIGGILIGDSGSAKDLNIICAPTREGCHDEDVAPVPAKPVQMQDLLTVTIKASYKGNIIRFRLPSTAGVVILKNEISKRLKMDVSMFDIKYMDDDREWVTLSCTADLEECIELSRQSGGNPIRLLVSDLHSNFGSSCESSRGR